MNPPLRRRRSKKPSFDTSSPAQQRLAIFSRPRTGRLSRQVAISLGSAGRLGKAVKEVAAEIGVPLRTAYRTIHRLEESGIVQRTPVGYALSSIVGDVTSDPSTILGFENIRWRVTNWQTAPPPPCSTANWHPVSKGDAGEARECELAWEGRTVRLFTPKKQRNNAAALRIMAQQQMIGRLPFECAIIGQITAEMAIPKTWSKKKQRAALCGEIWPAKRPDLSNICKQVEDALIGVVFRDDALIVRYDTMQKRYSAQPKIVATYQPVRS